MLSRRFAHDVAKAKEILSKHYIRRTADEKAYLREFEANSWLNGEGKKYKWSNRPVYVAGKFSSDDEPFPNNSFYKVSPPISDSVKEGLFQKFIENPKKYSVDDLAELYQLSIDRVKAIVKLKWLEKGMEAQGIALQHHYQSAMDKLLSAKSMVRELQKEDKLRYYKARENPIFVPSETGQMTADEAAHAMQADPFSKKIELINKAATKPFRIPKFLSDMYCPDVNSQNLKQTSKNNLQSINSVFKKVLHCEHSKPNTYYPGTLQSERSNPVYKGDSFSFTKPKVTTLFVDIGASKSTPKVRWDPRSQSEHIVPSVKSGKIIVRDGSGNLRTPKPEELRAREQWGKEIISRALYKHF